MTPTATTLVSLVANLDAREEILAANLFDQNDPFTYNHNTTVAVYDSLGVSHELAIYFVHTAANKWSVFVNADGYSTEQINAGLTAPPYTPNGTISFPAAGTGVEPTYTNSVGEIGIPFDVQFLPDSGAAAVVNLTIEISDMTQFGVPFSAEVEQNGGVDLTKTFYATDEDDVIQGTDGVDTVVMQSPEYDWLRTINNDDGSVTLYSLEGIDTLYDIEYIHYLETIEVIPVADLPSMYSAGNVLSQFVVGDGLNNHLEAGIGDDFLYGGNGDDILYGLAGNDFLVGDGGRDKLYGGAGDDTLVAVSGQNKLYGGTGSDRLFGGSGRDQLYGGDGADDNLYVGLGDYADGGEGLYAQNAAHFIDDFSADDIQYALRNHNGNVVIGFDSGYVELANISLVFVDGNPYWYEIDDLLEEHSASKPNITKVSNGQHLEITPDDYTGEVSYLKYQVIGGLASEVMTGTAFNDFLNLAGGDDAANGGDGQDVLDGGTGSNFLTGGNGDDTFFLDGRGGTTTWSTVTDFDGDQVNIWGWVEGVSKLIEKVTDAGAEGFKGATFHYDLDSDGAIDTSITFSGLALDAVPTSSAEVIAENGYLLFS